MHIGLEAEGRLKGVPTLIMSCEEFENNLHKTVTHPYANIYITDWSNKLDLDYLDSHRDPLKDPILSIERTKVSRKYENLNIIFFVSVPVFDLKDTDQIRMHNGQYVWMTPVEAMIKSTPRDFIGDFNV